MAKEHHASPLSVAYARALLELASELGQQEGQPAPADAIGQELRGVRQLIDESPGFRDFLRNPGIGEVERGAMLEKLFAGRASFLLWNFIRLLNSKRRLELLGTMDQVFQDLLDQQQGKVDVQVTVAQQLGDDQLEEVRRRVSDALGKHAVVQQTVDESIIGGLIVQAGDRVIDASVKQQLRSMRKRILAARPR
jgi:F-type H+-transporting ATPase subunit delta